MVRDWRIGIRSMLKYAAEIFIPQSNPKEIENGGQPSRNPEIPFPWSWKGSNGTIQSNIKLRWEGSTT